MGKAPEGTDMNFFTVIKALPWTDIIKLMVSIIGIFKKADEKKQAEITNILEKFNEKENKNEADITNLFDDIDSCRRM